MFGPVTRAYDLLDTLCVGADRHRYPLALAFGVLLAVGAVTPTGGFTNTAAIASATISGSGGALGYVSRWRGWGDR